MNAPLLLPRRVRLGAALFVFMLLLVSTVRVAYRQTAVLANAAPLPTAGSIEFKPIATLVGPTPTSGPLVAVPQINSLLFNDQRFSYEPDWYVPEVQGFLDQQPGPLKGLRVAIGDREHSFAEFLISQTSLYSLNPKLVLALIEQQSGLLSTANPSPEQLDWAMGFRGEDERWKGVVPQLRWAMRELRRGVREYTAPPELVYSDGSLSPVPANIGIAHYAIVRLLAATTEPSGLAAKVEAGSNSFLAVYERIFGNARTAPSGWPGPAAPFLSRPAARTFAITSFFDHDLPFLRENGSLSSYRGDRSNISYDGHTGWDYAMRPPEAVLAAADGTVVFAGNSDDGCGVAHVVVIDHGNGYRTLYWHLSEVLVGMGPITRGARLGIAGASGCATGPHLHFQVQYLGRDVDPYGWCGPAGGDQWANYPAGQFSTWLWSWMPSPCALPQDGTVVDTGDIGFTRSGPGWDELAGGIGGTSLLVTTPLSDTEEMAIGSWQPSLPAAGRYRVLAWTPYIYNGLLDAKAVTYTIVSDLGTTQAVIDQAATANSWADLGSYNFSPADAAVRLPARSTRSEVNVWYDAVIWIKED